MYLHVHPQLRCQPRSLGRQLASHRPCFGSFPTRTGTSRTKKALGGVITESGVRLGGHGSAGPPSWVGGDAFGTMDLNLLAMQSARWCQAPHLRSFDPSSLLARRREMRPLSPHPR